MLIRTVRRGSNGPNGWRLEWREGVYEETRFEAVASVDDESFEDEDEWDSFFDEDDTDPTAEGRSEAPPYLIYPVHPADRGDYSYEECDDPWEAWDEEVGDRIDEFEREIEELEEEWQRQLEEDDAWSRYVRELERAEEEKARREAYPEPEPDYMLEDGDEEKYGPEPEELGEGPGDAEPMDYDDIPF